MLARFLVWALFLLLLVRALQRFVRSIVQGAARPPRPTASSPEKGELMVRDPVCGTFVLPSRSSSLRDKAGTHHFCSDTCRQAYQAR